jgi:hypothetical protein
MKCCRVEWIEKMNTKGTGRKQDTVPAFTEGTTINCSPEISY